MITDRLHREPEHPAAPCRRAPGGTLQTVPTVSFEGETHQDIVAKVKRWLASQEADDQGALNAKQAISQGAELTKDALRIIAAAAPAPLARSELVHTLTGMGYRLTDATKGTLIDGLDTVEAVTGGSVLRSVTKAGANAVYEMNAGVAKAILRSIAR
jgi:hypothetical protein